MPRKIKTAAIILDSEEGDAARRISAILAGDAPREIDDKLWVNVPQDRLESALIFDHPLLKERSRA